MLNHKVFFDNVRESLFGGQMTGPQVEGMDTILREWQSRKNADLRHLGYMLATAFHETARTMQPIKEYGGNAYFHKMYDIGGSRPHVARALGNTQPGDGVKFCGRGFVQLTGRDNYARAGKKLGQDFVGNPDLVMKAPYAANIMFAGMEEGWFTGKKLSDYFNAKSDPYNARRIINGTDKANEIAALYSKFLAAIMKAAQAAPGLPTATPPILMPQEPTVSPFPTAQPGFPDLLGGIFGQIFNKSNEGTNALPPPKTLGASAQVRTIIIGLVTAVIAKFIPFAAILPPGIAEFAADWIIQAIFAATGGIVAYLKTTQTAPTIGSPLAQQIAVAKADVRVAENEAAVATAIVAPVVTPEPAFVSASDSTDLADIERLLRDARKARRRMTALLAELPDEEAADVVRQ